MTLPASGPLSLSQIQTEFGGSNPISLSEYYRGGARVPNIPANNNIPTSGPISLSQFYGASAIESRILTVGTNGTIIGYVVNPGGFGSLVSSLYKGLSIGIAGNSSTPFDFIFSLIGGSGLAQNFFSSLTINDGTGVDRTYNSAAAVHTPGTTTFWQWGSGSNKVFQAGDVGEAHGLIIVD